MQHPDNIMQQLEIPPFCSDKICQFHIKHQNSCRRLIVGNTIANQRKSTECCLWSAPSFNWHWPTLITHWPWPFQGVNHSMQNRSFSDNITTAGFQYFMQSTAWLRDQGKSMVLNSTDAPEKTLALSAPNDEVQTSYKDWIEHTAQRQQLQTNKDSANKQHLH